MPFGGANIVVKLGEVFLVQVPGWCQVTQAQQSFQGDDGARFSDSVQASATS